jgi:CHAT domain-containing protein
MKKLFLLSMCCVLCITGSLYAKEINIEQNFAKLEKSYQMGDYKVALAKLKPFQNQLSKRYGAESLPVVRAHALEARIKEALGDFGGYRTAVSKATSVLAVADKADANRWAAALNEIAVAYYSYEELELAARFNKEALLLQQKITDRFLINRINLTDLRIRYTQGYYNQVLADVPLRLKTVEESLSAKETYKDAKGKEKPVKYSKEEQTLRLQIYASMSNLQAIALIDNGEYLQAETLLGQNQVWIKKNLGTNENTYIESVYYQALIALEREDSYDAEKKLRRAESLASSTLRPQSDLFIVVEEALIPTLKLLEKNKEAQQKSEVLDSKIKSYYGSRSYTFQRSNLIDVRRYLLNQDWKKAESMMEKFLENKELVPEDHIQRAATLLVLYDVYVRHNKIEQAEKSLQEAAGIFKKKYGAAAPVYHMAQLRLAAHYVRYNDLFKTAEEIYAESLDKSVRNEVGAKNKFYSDFIYGQIHLLLLNDQFEKAKLTAQQMLEQVAALYTTQSVEYAQCLEKCAVVEIAAGRYEEAEKKLNQSIQIFQDKGGAQSRLNHALALGSKARLQILQGLFQDADATLRRSARLIKRASDTELYYSSIGEEIILLNTYLGRYRETEKILAELIAYREKHFGKNSSTLIYPLNAMGHLEYITGNYVEAERTIGRALELSKNKFGEKSSRYAESLKLLQNLYTSVGDYEKAEKAGAKVVEIARSVYGPNHLEVGKALEELALVKYFNRQPYSEVEALFAQALPIIRFNIGEQSPVYAEALENMAVFYAGTARLDEAAALLDKANAVWTSRLGEQNTYTARISQIKGDIFYLKKNYEEANKNYIKAKNTYAAIFDANHPGYVEALGKSAQMYYCLRDVRNAVLASEETIKKSLVYLDKIFPSLSERGKASYWEKVKNDFEFYKSLAFTQHTSYPDMIGTVFNITLKTKAILLSSSIKVRERILQSGDTTLIQNFQTWIDKRENLMAVLSLSAAQRKENALDVVKLESEIEELEKKLSGGSELFANVYEKKIQYDWKELRKVLKNDEVALELISFRLFDKKFTDTVWYAGLSVSQDNKSNPDFILLREGNEMENKYFRYYRNCMKFDVEDKLSYDVYWRPLQQLLKKEYSRIYLSVDGVYNQLNLEALRMPDDQYILDKYNLLLLSSTRDLLARNTAKKTDKNKTVSGNDKSIVLFGNPGYYPEHVAPDERKVVQLSGAEQEVRKLNQLLSSSKWNTTVYLSNQATEARVKALNSPGVFHIATHGFFLADVPASDVLDEVAEKAIQNPLLRSGLLLKNGGYLLEGGNVNDFNREDGILTSYEAMNLGLDNTELVVLSACETGLGEMKSGEGVYGLQRSFLVAGADAVIMSLFKVNDEKTTELMDLFYQKWLKGTDKRTAFVEAKKEMKNRYDTPMYWGAFLMVGTE